MENRREFLFFYDVSWANPNGDPMDENKPRIDEETRINIVTDTRLKRTIRDQLSEMGYEIFVREERDEKGKLKDRKKILEEHYSNDYEKVLEKCIDIRLFGGTFAIEGAKGNFTGPVQFKFGHSLHKVKVELIKGTTVMPSGEGREQGTMTEVWVVPYSFIVFYGIANEKAAKDTKLKDEDIDVMLKALWLGHKASTDVISRSKFGHEPRLLIEIIYKEKTLTHIGELNKLVKIDTQKREEELRDVEEFVLNLERLKERVQKYKDKIEKVRFVKDDRLKVNPSLEEVFNGITLERFPWAKEV
ncbi:MAG TPA: type I-B CRISPR-associated protein Cas7/Csh2 [Aquifex aeolicus]|nr:type I-B CRISPR-associated protein Cas7/Csh2 [Aquifex aeolicus]